MSLPRPPENVLRAPLKYSVKKHALIAAGISVVIAAVYKFTIADQRIIDYAEFHKNYDEKRHFNRMAQAGVFQSVKPNNVTPQWVKDYEKEVDKAITALKK